MMVDGSTSLRTCGAAPASCTHATLQCIVTHCAGLTLGSTTGESFSVVRAVTQLDLPHTAREVRSGVVWHIYTRPYAWIFTLWFDSLRTIYLCRSTAATPNIDAWARREGSIILEDMHSGGTVCSPTRATILTVRISRLQRCSTTLRSLLVFTLSGFPVLVAPRRAATISEIA